MAPTSDFCPAGFYLVDDPTSAELREMLTTKPKIGKEDKCIAHHVTKNLIMIYRTACCYQRNLDEPDFFRIVGEDCGTLEVTPDGKLIMTAMEIYNKARLDFLKEWKASGKIGRPSFTTLTFAVDQFLNCSDNSPARNGGRISWHPDDFIELRTAWKHLVSRVFAYLVGMRETIKQATDFAFRKEYISSGQAALLRLSSIVPLATAKRNVDGDEIPGSGVPRSQAWPPSLTPTTAANPEAALTQTIFADSEKSEQTPKTMMDSVDEEGAEQKLAWTKTQRTPLPTRRPARTMASPSNEKSGPSETTTSFPKVQAKKTSKRRAPKFPTPDPGAQETMRKKIMRLEASLSAQTTALTASNALVLAQRQEIEGLREELRDMEGKRPKGMGWMLN
ncbi:hypothetical protein F4779DRAFT_633172 [Xylariaceae sp. FL0662B]|nr:hypothetical protein F4779DRAFT_633172 [Xylariaceae sp. FL0662B]